MKKLMKEDSYLGVEYQIFSSIENGEAVVIVIDKLGTQLIRQNLNFREDECSVAAETQEAGEFWVTAVQIAEQSVQALIDANYILKNNKLNPFE